jgi:hypothetical protein
MWLGETRGELSDWATQQWVIATGRRVELATQPWLNGPVGPVRGIGPEFFPFYAKQRGLRVVADGAPRGLLRTVSDLALEHAAHPAVIDFYEQTSEYELDAWAEWCGAFRPFGNALARIFSRRLQQLNVPLSPLDTSRGITSHVLHLLDPQTGEVRETAWVRQLVGTNHLLYAGSYSVARVPGHPRPCVKVVFPLPNGNAQVLMRCEAQPDGSLTVTSSGQRFGDPGFYFVVHRPPHVWARYVRTMRESIHVYAAEAGIVRADHILRLWGTTFLQLHYRLKRWA